ncbi:MAG: BlaI/MecI/CopY family transcriptional regulator [Solirubrobacterales bacterium]
MAKQDIPRPTDGELTILRVLWERGPSTVRQVHRAVCEDRETAQTTTLKLMQIMTDKGLLSRDDSDRPAVYSPAITQEKTQRQLLRNLLDKAFCGSTGKLVMRALSLKQTSPGEREEIRKLLDQLEGDKP